MQMRGMLSSPSAQTSLSNLSTTIHLMSQSTIDLLACLGLMCLVALPFLLISALLERGLTKRSKRMSKQATKSKKLSSWL